MTDPFKALLDAAVTEAIKKHMYILEAALRQAFYDGVAFELKRQSAIRTSLLKEITNEPSQEIPESVVRFPAGRRSEEKKEAPSEAEAGVRTRDDQLQGSD